MKQNRIGTVEQLEADSSRAYLEYDAETESYTPVMSVNYATLAEMEPLFIDDVPGVLDQLGLKNARQKMDAAHNEMIRTKFDLAIWKETPGLIVKPTPDKSPFTAIREEKPQPAPVSAADIQAAIDAASIRDPEYRKAAKEYLTEVLPAVKEENARLIAELNTARAELAQITQKYKAKLNKAAAQLAAFNKGVEYEYKKFEIANEGSRTAENHIITTPNCRKLVGYNVQKYEKYALLEAIQDKINALEAAAERDKDPAYIKELARSNAAEHTTVVKDASGIAGKIGAFFK